MSTGKIAFVVGHAHWGKSLTLRALKGGDFRPRRTTIGGAQFFIRSMSNDDRSDEYADFMRGVSTVKNPYLIAALCPRFGDKDGEAAAAPILAALRDKGYDLFFWVIEHQYHQKSAPISSREIQSLRGFGTVEVFSDRAEAAVRAAHFKQFVEKTVLA